MRYRYVLIFLLQLCSLSSAQLNQTIDSSLLSDNGGIVWNNLQVSADSTVLLPPFSFHIGNGRVCGIIGPSGSGKSTLLTSILAGSFTANDGNIQRTGQLWRYRRYDDNKVHLRRLHSSQVAFLQQQDEFFELLTVQETLEFAAFLELPYVSEVKRSNQVQQLLDSLGLAHVSHRWIGNIYNPHKGRLSGGERRRLSVARELVTEKSVLVADEPTTGLDVTLSKQVVRMIRQLVIEKNIPCILTLHQPRSSIWNELLDDCIVMAPNGRVCFAGETKSALSYFKTLGYPIPPATNPAEFLVDLVSIDTENNTQAALDEARVDALAAAFQKHQAAHRKPPLTEVYVENDFSLVPERYRISPFHWFSRFGALLRRSWRQNIRNRAFNLSRLVVSIGNAYLLTRIYPTIHGPLVLASSVADRVVLLSFGAISNFFMAYIKTVELFAKERPVVRRERMRHQYTVIEYLLAKALTELPLDASFAAVFASVLKFATGLQISWAKLTGTMSLLTISGASLGFLLGSWTQSEQIASISGIPVIVIAMVLGIINPSGVDPSLSPDPIIQALKKFSPFTFSVEALCIGEYTGMKFARRRGWWFRGLSGLPRMGGLALVRNGEQVLEALGLIGKTYNDSMVSLALITASSLFLSWLGLVLHTSGNRPNPSSRSSSEMNRKKRNSNGEISTSTTSGSVARAYRRIRL